MPGRYVCHCTESRIGAEGVVGASAVGRTLVAVDRAGVLAFVLVLLGAFVLAAGALAGVFALVCVLVVFVGVLLC